jgi:HK97 family phage portal protein
LESQKFGTDWFQHGGFPPGTFRNSAKTVDAADADVIKNRLVSAIRSRKPLVFGNDWEWKAETIPPEQAQFIETFKLTANQIAAIYGIAPEEIGGEAANSMTYMNEEHRELRRMSDCRPWIVRLETKFSSWIPERSFVRFNVDAPVRVDLLTRRQVFKLEREMGFRNIDEQRALEDLPPLPGGQGKDYTPLSKPAAATGQLSLPLDDEAPAMNGHSPTPVPA